MSNVGNMGMPRINFASSMVVEDHLKKVLTRTDGKRWKPTDNKLLPKSQHSAFGDFPKDYMPKKGNPVQPIQPIAQAEQSIAATGTGKSLRTFNSNKSTRYRARFLQTRRKIQKMVEMKRRKKPFCLAILAVSIQ